jgi:hypothetical protein
MAKKNNKPKGIKIVRRKLTEEQQTHMLKMFGFIAGHFSKVILAANGYDVNYKINGEDISDIKGLQVMDIQQRIGLAVKEERYEDAAKLKKLLNNK